jgi:uncharacterized protein (DUF305 family)
MKKSIFLGLVLLAVMVLFSSCSQTASNTAMNHDSMNHDSMNHNSMNHNSMPMNSNSMVRMDMKSDADAASAPYDLQFIDTMTHHHEGAIRMAEAALKNSQNDELKKFAQKIIDDQRKENVRMKEWREKWYAGKPAAKNMEMPGMMDSMKTMGDNPNKLEMSSGKEFDLMFLNSMIPHHEGAIKMAKEALQKAEHAEIKTLANEIIKAQEDEIKKMTDWKARWSK